MPSFLLDHCVWHPTAQALKRAGFVCATLRTLGFAEAKNGDILALGKKRQQTLITRDADFADTNIYPLGSHAGIIYLRITPRTMTQVHRMLLTALRKITPERLRGALLTVEPADYRLKRP